MGTAQALYVEDVICTQLLQTRPPGPPRWQEEAEAFRRLAAVLAHGTSDVLNALVREALVLCEAGSVGVSLLETRDDGTVVFRWAAMAGQCAPYLGGSAPRDFSPCGICLDQNEPILLCNPIRFFTYIEDLPFPVLEALVLPLRAENELLGTIWILSHDENRKFTSEDVRSMSGLADFCATALRLQAITDEKEDAKRVQTAALEMLDEQRRGFDTALSNIVDFAYVFDLKGRFTFANRALLALWQKSFDEVAGKNFFDLGYPEDLATKLQTEVQTVIETQEPVRGQTGFTGPSGETRFYEYIFVPVFDADEKVRAVAGSTRDITQRRLSETLIQDDRRRWQDLLAQTPSGVALLSGPEHRFTWVNAVYERVVGRTADELIGKSVAEALPEASSQVYIDLLNNVYKTGTPFQGTESLVKLGADPDNLKEFYVNFAYLPTRDANLQIDGIFVYVNDVTEFVTARREVEDREQQFRTLAESIPHLAWMADPDGSIFWYNRRWYEYTGTTLEEMQGWRWKSVHDPHVLSSVMERWTKAVTNGETFEMVFPLKGRDGSFRTFLTRVEPVRSSNGEIVRWFGTNTDITDQRRTEEELRRINRGLEEFAYVASHDLQEPLRMVNIYSHLLVRHVGTPDQKSLEFAGFIKSGLKQMETLIQDLLTYSRTVQKDDIPAGKADLSEALNIAIPVLRAGIEESHAILDSSPLPVVRGEVKQLSHVFQNLISNSLKYRKPNVAPLIRISAEREGENWKISFSDNGIGFEPRYAKKIFGLFQRLHDDAYPGTGLGLAICQRIVERYGGHMWAEGRPSEGSTFHFVLPAADSL